MLSAAGFESNKIGDIIEEKKSIAKKQIAKEINKGAFPILGYSYYEYGNVLGTTDPYSSLLYLEYALELSSLEIYFEGSEQILVLGVGFPKITVSDGMEAALTDGKLVFLVANQHRYNWSQIDRLKLIAEYPRSTGEKLMFYEVF